MTVLTVPAVQASQPFFRWAGSKRKLIPKLDALKPQSFQRYVEPFAGSACFFLHLRPRQAVLGDINRELINAYSQLRDSPNDVADLLDSIPDRSPSTYYLVRGLKPEALTRHERAARFVYLNRLCFNGLYRTNAKGDFNVPFGGERAGRLPDRAAILTFSTKLVGVELVDGDFLTTVAKAQPGDFVYLDPPYSIAARRVFNNYSHHAFGGSAIEQLETALERLNRLGAKFLVSYGLSKEGLALAKPWNKRQTTVQRQISGFAAHRRVAGELLITNY